MRARNSLIMGFPAVIAMAMLSAVEAQPKVELAVQKVAMGDYEVVENWPRP